MNELSFGLFYTQSFTVRPNQFDDFATVVCSDY